MSTRFAAVSIASVADFVKPPLIGPVEVFDPRERESGRINAEITTQWWSAPAVTSSTAISKVITSKSLEASLLCKFLLKSNVVSS